MGKILRDLRNIMKYFLPPLLLFIFGWLFYLAGSFSYISWLDNILHFTGGMILGFTYFLILRYFESREYLKLNRFFMIFFVIALVSLTVVLWEFYQFLLGFFTNIPVQLTLEDTLFDLFLGLLGGLVSIIFIGSRRY